MFKSSVAHKAYPFIKKMVRLKLVRGKEVVAVRYCLENLVEVNYTLVVLAVCVED